jgi:hypothetical protein
MDTTQILCTLRDVKSFFGVFPSHMLPRSVTETGAVIINADPHTEKGSHWLAIYFLSESSSAYFDSYGILPLGPDIRTFIRRTCTVWDYNRRQLQGLTSNVCGKYCSLFALYTDGGLPPNNLSGNLTERQQTDRSKGPSRPNSNRRAAVAVNAAPAFYKR